VYQEEEGMLFLTLICEITNFIHLQEEEEGLEEGADNFFFCLLICIVCRWLQWYEYFA